MKERNIALIGFRATGKSLIGSLLAQRLGWTFVDMDERLVSSSGEDISRWVKKHGWESFRAAESSLLLTLSAQERLVTATGGGVVLIPANREALRRHFFVVWLQASPETIVAHMMQDPKTASQRPPLTTLSLEEEIVSLLDERSRLYEETADLTLKTDTVSPDQILAEILTVLSPHS